MFNPLVDSFAELSDAQLDEKIAELSRKYFMSTNPNLKLQISAILDMYREEIKSRRARQQLQSQQDGDSGLDNLININ